VTTKNSILTFYFFLIADFSRLLLCCAVYSVYEESKKFLIHWKMRGKKYENFPSLINFLFLLLIILQSEYGLTEEQVAGEHNI
jgi:hypothetical protein